MKASDIITVQRLLNELEKINQLFQTVDSHKGEIKIDTSYTPKQKLSPMQNFNIFESMVQECNQEIIEFVFDKLNTARIKIKGQLDSLGVNYAE